MDDKLDSKKSPKFLGILELLTSLLNIIPPIIVSDPSKVTGKDKLLTWVSLGKVWVVRYKSG